MTSTGGIRFPTRRHPKAENSKQTRLGGLLEYRAGDSGIEFLEVLVSLVGIGRWELLSIASCLRFA
jgi:hypothetical protein